MEPAPRHRRWVWIGIIVAIPALVIAALQAVFSLNAVGPVQVNAPRSFYKPNPAAAQNNPPVYADALSRAPGKEMAYEEFIAKVSGEDVAAIYTRLTKSKMYKRGRELDFPFTWKDPPRLTQRQKDWLVANHGIVEDILKLCDLGGLPTLSCEQALGLGLDVQNAWKFPQPDSSLGMRCASVLVAESRRLREAGDDAGAVRAVLGIEQLANSISRPEIWNVLNADFMKLMEYRCVSEWLMEPPPPDIARLLLGELSKSKPTDYIGPIEFDYRRNRKNLIEVLNGSLGQIMSVCRQANMERTDIFSFVDQVQVKPAATITSYAGAFTEAIRVKSSASAIVREVDAYYANAVLAMSTGERIKPPDIFPRVLHFENVDFYIGRRNAAQALLNLDLTALNELTAGPQPLRGTDPFTRQPLHRVEESTTMLFYSVGPDRTDQRAGVVYDPSNGTNSGGDIVVRIRKVRESRL